MLKKDIENWLADNGFQVNIDQDKEYSYNFPLDTIYIGEKSIYTIASANLFKYFLKEHGCNKVFDFNIHTLAFLHELGHHFTVPSFNETELNFYAVMKNIIIETYSNEDTANLKYWQLQDELAANNWAINFINNNYSKAKALDKIMSLAN